jgi:hypothetical protein
LTETNKKEKKDTKNEFDNYNHYDGVNTSNILKIGTIYQDKDGDSISVETNSDGTFVLQLLKKNSPQKTLISDISSPNMFHSLDNTIEAKVTIPENDDNEIIIVKTSDGNKLIFKQLETHPLTSTQYFGSTGDTIQPEGANNYNLGYGSVHNGVTNNKQNGMANNNNYNGMNRQDYGSQYFSTLPKGIPASQIPQGQENLYILKSEIVPPVCPACPSVVVPRQEPPPPCPACARCPEPSFDCKKVPNYSAINNDFLPTPILNDFSQFGM